MEKDTRSRNNYFKAEDIAGYLKDYAATIEHGLNKVSPKSLVAMQNLLRLTLARGGRIFVGGNGGSAAISDHLKCDFEKGTHSDSRNNLIVHSLSSSVSTLTAIGNDMGYDRTLEFQLELSRLTSSDTVILISSSGNSRNIINAAVYAKGRCADVVGLTGFDGGELKKLSTVSLHIPINNYGVVEDCHQALMHIFAQYHYLSVNNV